MSVRYIYNSAGDYVAFLAGDNLFSPTSEWLGFLHSGNEMYRPDGTFLGYVLDDDRVVRKQGEPLRPRVFRPLKPLKPLRPLRPLRRLKMPRVPAPYEDVFEGTQVKAAEGDISADLDHLEGSTLAAEDGTFLGNVNHNRFDSNSVLNQFGPFGSRYGETSIFNVYGQYGGKYGQHSILNKYSSSPPRFVKNNKAFAYLSNNKYLKPRIDPEKFFRWLGKAQ